MFEDGWKSAPLYADLAWAWRLVRFNYSRRTVARFDGTMYKMLNLIVSDTCDGGSSNEISL